MPTVSCDAKALLNATNLTTNKQFEDICFEFGIELEDVVEEEGRTTFKIDIPANRYDMLCFEGIARALKTYLEIEAPPTYTITEAKERIYVKSSTQLIRPFVVCAILRGIEFDQMNYDSFIDLQDKLHNNICRF